MEVVLENGNQTIALKIKQGKNGNIFIARDGAKAEEFRPCNGKNFVAWVGVVLFPFQDLSCYRTVTIRGYIRTLIR